MSAAEWTTEEVTRISLAATRSAPCALARSDAEVLLAIDLATEIGAAYMIQRGEVDGASYASVEFSIQRVSGQWVQFDLLNDPLYLAFVRDFESGALPLDDLPLLAALSATYDAFCNVQEKGGKLSGLASCFGVTSVQLGHDDQLVVSKTDEAPAQESSNGLSGLMNRWRKS